MKLHDSARDRDYVISFHFSLRAFAGDEEILEVLRTKVNIGVVRTMMAQNRLMNCVNGGAHMPCILVIEGAIGHVITHVRADTNGLTEAYNWTVLK